MFQYSYNHRTGNIAGIMKTKDLTDLLTNSESQTVVEYENASIKYYKWIKALDWEVLSWWS